MFCDQAETAQASDSTLAEKGTLKEITALEAQLKRQIDMVSDRMMSLSSQYGNFDRLLLLLLFLLFLLLFPFRRCLCFIVPPTHTRRVPSHFLVFLSVSVLIGLRH